jgi:hypothetical protein
MKKNSLITVPDKIFGISSSLIKLFLPPLGLFLFFLTSYSWLISPRIDSIKSLITSSESIKGKIKITDEKLSYLLSVDQDQLKKDAGYLSSAVLKEKNSYLLLGILKDIAKEYGYAITSFSLSIKDFKENKNSLKIADKSMAVKMPINIEMSGPTDKFIDLIKSIENSLPILFLDKIENTQESGNTFLKMTISSYYAADNFDLVSDNLTLSDLKLTKEESDLLTKISQFEKSPSLDETFGQDSEKFIEYDRPRPF